MDKLNDIYEKQGFLINIMDQLLVLLFCLHFLLFSYYYVKINYNRLKITGLKKDVLLLLFI